MSDLLKFNPICSTRSWKKIAKQVYFHFLICVCNHSGALFSPVSWIFWNTIANKLNLNYRTLWIACLMKGARAARRAEWVDRQVRSGCLKVLSVGLNWGRHHDRTHWKESEGTLALLWRWSTYYTLYSCKDNSNDMTWSIGTSHTHVHLCVWVPLQTNIASSHCTYPAFYSCTLHMLL